MLTDSDYCIRVISLPGSVNSVVRLSPDGFANIYVNECLSPNARRRAVAHELRHIIRNDFYNSRSIMEVENDAEN